MWPGRQPRAETQNPASRPIAAEPDLRRAGVCEAPHVQR